MDEAGIEAKGLSPLQPHLDAIAAIRDKRELARALGESLRADVDALNNTNFHTDNLFGLWVAPGFNDSEHYTAYLMQGGLELPDREYYLSDSADMREIRSQVSGARCDHAEARGIQRHRCSRGAHRRTGTCDRGEASQPGRERTTSTRRTIPGMRPTSPPRLRASIGQSTSAAQG